MGRMKERLYYFVVERNANVKKEYEDFVRKNMTEHFENRGKHWRMIVKLNWHYRVLRKKTPCIMLQENMNQNKNQSTSAPKKAAPAPNKTASTPKEAPVVAKEDISKMKIYMNGPESEVAKRPEPYHFVKDLLKHDVVSFDIFDTLVFRPFSNPTDLFNLVGKRLEFPAIFTSFKEGRIEAEKEVRSQREKEYGTREINIYEIYEQMKQKFNIPVELGVKIELETEADYLMPNPYMKVVFEILKSQNKTIVLTSDMYIPGEEMEKLLKKCGYEGYDKLYVSCDYRCNKITGELFRRVKKDYKGKTIIHVGDSLLSDIEGAKKVNIPTRHYKGVNEFGKQFRADWMSGITMSAYSGLMNAYLHNGLNKYPFFYEYGFVYGGIYAFGFCNWLEEKAKKEGIDKILFLSRDGDIYQKIYNKYFGSIENDYIYWSRFVNMKYLIEMQQDAFINRVIKQKATGALDVELSSIFKTFCFEIDKKELKKYGLSYESPINAANVEKIKLCMKANWEKIVPCFESERELAIEEVRTLLGDAKKVAVIDVGWTASGPLGFKAFVEQYVTKDCDIRCWMAGGAGTYGTGEYVLPYYMDESVSAYLFSPMHNKRNEQVHMVENPLIANNAVFELFTQAQYPSYRGRSAEGGYEFDIPESENYKIIGEVQKGIMDFCQLYYNTFKKDPYMFNISGFDAYRPFAKLAFNCRYFEKNFRDIVYCYGLSGDQNHQCIETMGARMDNILARRGGKK